MWCTLYRANQMTDFYKTPNAIQTWLGDLAQQCIMRVPCPPWFLFQWPAFFVGWFQSGDHTPPLACFLVVMHSPLKRKWDYEFLLYTNYNCDHFHLHRWQNSVGRWQWGRLTHSPQTVMMKHKSVSNHKLTSNFHLCCWDITMTQRLLVSLRPFF